MEDLFEAIRIATASDATDEARATGAAACRTLLAALEATPGATMTPAVEPAIAEPPATQSPDPRTAAHAIASVLRGMTPDQLLDLAITRLRAALPAGVEVPAAQPVTFHLIPISR